MFGMIRIASLALTISLISLPSQASEAGSTEKMNWKSLRCLALNIYHEARGEPLQGKIAVAHVVLNRVAARRFPAQICAVIQQGGERRRYRCQFSWWCDGRSDKPRDVAAWRESLLVALLIRRGATDDPTKGALWYHADTVKPYWSKVFKPYNRDDFQWMIVTFDDGSVATLGTSWLPPHHWPAYTATMEIDLHGTGGSLNIDDSHRVVLSDIIIQSFGKQGRLVAIGTLNKSAHE